MLFFNVTLLTFIMCLFLVSFFVSLSRRIILKSVLGPTAEILSFASPKESIQRKGDPDAAYSLRSSRLNGVAGRGFPAPPSTRCIPASPLRAIPFKSSGARRGIREKTVPHKKWFIFIGYRSDIRRNIARD
jgi:hypothetical protein